MSFNFGYGVTFTKDLRYDIDYFVMGFAFVFFNLASMACTFLKIFSIIKNFFV